jgi:hypothetical protein
MSPRVNRPDHPLRLLRFLVALLLLLPALLSGYTLHGPAALDIIVPFTAALLVFPATRRQRFAGIVAGALTAVVLGAAGRHDAEVLRVLMVSLATVGFLAWARWVGDEARSTARSSLFGQAKADVADRLQADTPTR